MDGAVLYRGLVTWGQRRVGPPPDEKGNEDQEHNPHRPYNPHLPLAGQEPGHRTHEGFKGGGTHGHKNQDAAHREDYVKPEETGRQRRGEQWKDKVQKTMIPITTKADLSSGPFIVCTPDLDS